MGLADPANRRSSGQRQAPVVNPDEDNPIVSVTLCIALRLRLSEVGDHLVNASVAASQLAQQPPAHRMAGEAQKFWRCCPSARRFRCCHNCDNASIRIDAKNAWSILPVPARGDANTWSIRSWPGLLGGV